MARRPDSKTAGGLAGSMSDEAVDAYADLGGRLAAQMAEEAFRSVTADADWTAEDVDAETEQAITRLEITARDMHAARGLDPDGAEWSQVWSEMERRYRARMGELLREIGPRGRGTVQ